MKPNFKGCILLVGFGCLAVAMVAGTAETGNERVTDGNSKRSRRDYDHGDYHVKCKHSNTGEFAVKIFASMSPNTFFSDMYIGM
jgi:pyrroline-5-carboxylate reductase